MKTERAKGFISGILLSVLLFSLVGTAAATIGSRTLAADYTDIKIQLDGQQITPTDANGIPVEPFAINGTTYLPVRAVSNALSLGVEWDGTTNTVILSSPKTPELPYEIHDCYTDFSVPTFENVIGYDALIDVYQLSTGDSVLYTYNPAYFDYSITDNYLTAYMKLLEYYGFERDQSKEEGMNVYYKNPISGMIVTLKWDDTTDLVYVLIMSIQNPPAPAPVQISPNDQIYTLTPQELRQAYLAEVDAINNYYDPQINELKSLIKESTDALSSSIDRVNGGLGSSYIQSALSQTAASSPFNAQLNALIAERDAALADAKLKYQQ